MRRLRHFHRFLLACLVLLCALPAFPQKAPEVFAEGGSAIRGHDPVAYFSEGRAVKGSEKFTHAWKGASWRFASAENRDRFAADPERFAPRYGGYCAYGVAGGYTVSTDPAAWSIVGGRLYLNYSLSVQRDWNSDVPGYIRKADANWPKALLR